MFRSACILGILPGARTSAGLRRCRCRSSGEWTRRFDVARRPAVMHRRTFIKAAAGAGVLTTAGALATPAISQRAAARVLRFVPQADLANFDPIQNTQYVVRNGAALVWDMLYGVDDKLQPRRQMAESEDVSSDGLVWTFRLRPGLKFHDGEPVLSKDVVASVARWQARDNMGLMTKEIEQELIAVDDRTFRWVLKKPYPKLLVALGKVGTPSCFIMPARIAATDPFKPIGEYVGSGPMQFVRNEWIPGARAVFERFADYAPRQEPNSWLSGGKYMLLDRIEWIVMPDPATASAALQRGRRRNSQRSTPSRCRQTIAGGQRLFRSAGHLRGCAGPANYQSSGRGHCRPAQKARRERRFRRRRLGHERSAAGAEIAAGPGRLADVPYLARRRGLYRSVVLYRDPRQWRQGVVRLAHQCEGRSRDRRLVRGKKSR